MNELTMKKLCSIALILGLAGNAFAISTSPSFLLDPASSIYISNLLTTAGNPNSCRLTDGTSFYNGATAPNQVTLDTDLNSFKTANHTDEASILASVASMDGKLPGLLSTAPASDTGQAALPVRIISQLGAGTGGGGGGSVPTGTAGSPSTSVVSVQGVDSGNRVNTESEIITLSVDRTAVDYGIATFRLTFPNGHYYDVSYGATDGVDGPTLLTSLLTKAKGGEDIKDFSSAAITLAGSGGGGQISTLYGSSGVPVVSRQDRSMSGNFPVFEVIHRGGASELTLRELTDKVSTSALQTTGNTSLASIVTNTTGLSTASAQTTANSSLSSIDTKLSSQATAANQTTGNSSLSTIASNTTGLATVSAQTTGNSSLSSIDTKLSSQATASNQTTANSSLSSIDTKLSSQATAANQTTLDTDLKATQPRKMQDGSGNALTSQANGSQRALDVGVNVAGVQIDPRQVRALTSADVVTVSGGSTAANQVTANTSLATIATNTGASATAANQSTELTTLSGIKTGTDKIPASPSQEHTTAASPSSTRISNGTSFVDPTQTRALTSADQITIANTNLIVTDGTQIGAATMPTGGVGGIGWLSALYDRLGGSGNTEANALYTRIASPTKTTYLYSSGTAAFTPVATATDMIQIKGSATKTLRVLDFVVCPSATAAGAQTMYLVKRSSANSGGTSAAVTAGSMDSNNAAVSGTVVTYSANATSLGSVVWTRPRRVMFQITAGTSAMEPCTNLLQYLQDNIAGEPPTLRGTAESLSLNNNAAALAAGYRIDSWYAVVTEE